MLILIVQKDVKMDQRLSVQQLDEDPVADEKGSEMLRKYYRRYREIDHPSCLQQLSPMTPPLPLQLSALPCICKYPTMYL